MATTITNAALIAACKQLLTEKIPYTTLDCQGAFEEALHRAGIPLSECNLGGSNAHYRRCLGRWTPEQFCELLGVKEVPAGFPLFITGPENASTPAKYRGDGYGEASHIGIYMGGGQTFNSSESVGKKTGVGVVVSDKFKGKKAVNGGWNMVGWSEWIDCGLTAAQKAALMSDANYTGGATAIGETDAIGDAEQTEAAASATVAATPITQTYGVVVTPDGNPLKAREKPEKTAIWKYSIPNGTRVQILGEKGNYYKVYWLGSARWCQKDFIQM